MFNCSWYSTVDRIVLINYERSKSTRLNLFFNQQQTIRHNWIVCMYVKFTATWMCIGVENYAKYGEHKCMCLCALKPEEIASDCEKIYSVDAIFISFSEAFRFSRENIIEMKWNEIHFMDYSNAYMHFGAQNKWFLIKNLQIDCFFLHFLHWKRLHIFCCVSKISCFTIDSKLNIFYQFSSSIYALKHTQTNIEHVDISFVSHTYQREIDDKYKYCLLKKRNRKMWACVMISSVTL